MSLINIYGDGLLDVWNEAFGEVWFGSQIAYVGAPVCRTVTVEAETRTVIVSAENRIVEVSCP